jgi:hypothetical protein
MAKKKLAKQRFNLGFFLLLLSTTLVIGFLIVVWSIVRPFCANSRSCVSGLKVENNIAGVFNGQKVVPPSVDLATNVPDKKVLGEAVGTGEKHIYVDLSTQTLRAYQGEALFMEAKVSTGKWNKTPTGEFTIWEKLKATRMSGGTGADFYDLPNVPFTMFFEGKNAAAGAGFSLHGAYWHNNFGHPMSHGCVNMRIVDAQKLFYWVNPTGETSIVASTKDNPGTKITIYNNIQ